MLHYARQRAKGALRIPRSAVIATNGPAGLRVGEFLCEAIDLDLYLLVPYTSDHLFNLEHNSDVTLLTAGWELKGQARMIPSSVSNLKLDLVHEPGAEWCTLIRIIPWQMQIRREQGWGNIETIDLRPNES